MYFDIRDYLYGAATEDELIELLLNYNQNKANERTSKFR